MIRATLLVTGEGQYPDGAEDRLPPPDSPYYLADPSQLCVPELDEDDAGGVRGPVLFPPPPNCRIREVHCGNQVRLVVVAIRDIGKGEEITVDYNLAEWGENALAFHRAVSPRGFECAFNPDSSIKKEEDVAPSLPLSLTVSDYLTPSWSLSPSSSPLSRSEASDSDREDEEEEEDEEEDDEDEDEEEEEELEGLRGCMMRRRKKRKTPDSAAKKKPSPLSFPPPSSHFQPPLAPPSTNINNNININISSGGAASRKQHCPHCGRHFRSLARHLEKHHEHQPEIRHAMELSHAPRGTHTSNSTHTHSAHSFTSPQPSSSSSSSAVPSLFSRDSSGSAPPAMSFSLSLSPPTLRTASEKSPAPPVASPRKAASSAPAAAKKSPGPPAKRGRRPKREKEEKPKKQEEPERGKEEAPPTPKGNEEKEREEDEELEVKETKENESGEDKNGASSHVSPLLSSLSTLVLYLRRQQHSSFMSLSRSSGSAESWRLLCHSSLALLILYNRHRECEMAKLTISDYRARVAPSSNSTSSLEASLSPFERQVLCHRPRVGVLGKRGRVQTLILPPHSESCLDLLLKTSSDVNVDPESPFVFSRPYHSPATPLRGTDLLRGLARSSGAKNPTALTSPRNRRQVAILTQLLLMDEDERVRLERFLHSETRR
ncbi:apoptotic chromatin condensation inducer in the nucleus-like [Trichomycterus rosablanca]|uniref:apoptotic chromatin condensation inducer in the nucleus-like n=1 Tax=Trichomycterus rosablanca TaxID=2290929 RepID=UPI002F353B52